MDDTKPAIRRAMRRRRRALSARDVATAERAVADHLQGLEVYRGAPALIAYVGTDNEVPTGALLVDAAAAGKQIFLPRLVGGRLCFAAYDPEVGLQAGPYGIPEPKGSALADADIASAIAVIPLLAWDASGARVGRGGGHYDRAVAGTLRPGCLVGLGYAFQRCVALPRDPWDLRLDWVVTEIGAVRCGNGDDSRPCGKESEEHHDELFADSGSRHRAGSRAGLGGGLRPPPTG